MKDPTELPWKEFDIETQRDLDKAYEFRHEDPYYVYKYKFDDDKELEYTIHLMHDDDKMFQTNDGTDVKRPVKRTPLAQVTSSSRVTTCKDVQKRAAAARETQGGVSQAASSTPAAPKRKDSGETPRQVRSKSWMHSEHKAGPDTVTDNQGAEFGKIDLENTLYDIVMRHEHSFKDLQIPWHLEESKFTDSTPPLCKIGKVDEFLLRVLNKLI